MLFSTFDVGEFGHVYRAKLTLQEGKTILVAAKTLKVANATYSSRRTL